MRIRTDRIHAKRWFVGQFRTYSSGVCLFADANDEALSSMWDVRKGSLPTT